MPPVTAAAMAAEAHPAGRAAQGAESAEVAELRVREMPCSAHPGVCVYCTATGTQRTEQLQ